MNHSATQLKRSEFRCFSKVALRFRRWGRHSYSAFCSVGRTVTIGHLSQGIADASLRKDKGIQSVSLSRQLSEADDGSSAPGFCRTEDFPPDLASLWNLAFLLMPGVLFLRIQSPAGLVYKSLPAEQVSAVRGTMACHAISRPMESIFGSIGRAFAVFSRPSAFSKCRRAHFCRKIAAVGYEKWPPPAVMSICRGVYTGNVYPQFCR